MTAYHLAQLNIGRIVDAIDSEAMAGFVERLDEINALAEQARGFVWRLVGDDSNDATSIHIFEDDMLLINMSVWEDAQTLHDYTYKTAHAELLKQRKQWFERLTDAHMVLWWIPAGHIPTTTEARERLDHLREHGATPYAFTFQQQFAPQGSA